MISGHLAQDCFKTGEGSYDLIPDLDEYMQSVSSEKTQSAKKHKNKVSVGFKNWRWIGSESGK